MIKLSKWLADNSRKADIKPKLTVCPSKSDPRYQMFVSGCLTKKCFKTKEDVIKFLEVKADRSKNLYAYKCKFCTGWHFTSKHYGNKKFRSQFKSEQVIQKARCLDALPPFEPDSWGWKQTKAFLENLTKKED